MLLFVLPTSLGAGIYSLADWAATTPSVDPAFDLPLDHPWLENATDPAAVRSVLLQESHRLTPDFVERLAFARPTDGAVRFVATLDQRDGLIEASIEAALGNVYWLGETERFIGIAQPDALAALMSVEAITLLEADFPLELSSSRETLAMNIRNNGTPAARGEGIWHYNASTGGLESDHPLFDEAVSGEGATVAVLDTGIDKTHPDFYQWHCAPGSDAEAFQQSATEVLEAPECSSRIKASVSIGALVYDQTGMDAGISDALPTDQLAMGHGTHMAGLIAGNAFVTRNGTPDPSTFGGDGHVFGGAPKAGLVSVNIADDRNTWTGGLTEQVYYVMAAAGFNWIIDHAEEHGIQVIASGISCRIMTGGTQANGCNSAPSGSAGTIRAEIQRAYQEGIVTVFPVGNTEINTAIAELSALASLSHVVGVGSYDPETQRINRFSPDGGTDTIPDPYRWDPEAEPNFLFGGPAGYRRPDVMAPGSLTWAANPVTGTTTTEVKGDVQEYYEVYQSLPRDESRPYNQLLGTSVAAALTASVAALLYDACPDARPLDVMRALFVGAHENPDELLLPDGGPTDSSHVSRMGYGALDARLALDWILTQDVCSTTLPPHVSSAMATALNTSHPGLFLAGKPINFTATYSDEDGDVTQWHWDFGDGNSSDDAAAQHAYETAGDYHVQLTITDSDGAQNKTHPLFLRVREIDPGPMTPISASQLPLNLTHATAGSGTSDDPFILEDLHIQMDDTSESPDETSIIDDPGVPTVQEYLEGGSPHFPEAIRIDNETAHVVIRNVWIEPQSSGAPMAINLSGAGEDRVRMDHVVVCGAHVQVGIDGAPNGTIIRNTTTCNAETGIMIRHVQGDPPPTDRWIIEGCYMVGDATAINLRRGDNHTIRGCVFKDNGVAIESGGEHTEIHNNVFEGGMSGYFALPSGISNDKTLWSVVPQETPNIIGGPRIGGNLWLGKNPIDLDSDGFADEPSTQMDPTEFDNNDNTNADGNFHDSAAGDFRRMGRDEYPLAYSFPPPTVNFSFEPNLSTVGSAPTEFTSAATTGPWGLIQRWSWNFGDGTWFNTTDPSRADPQHAYASGGDYNVSLTVKDHRGMRAAVNHTVRVNEVPVAFFTSDHVGLTIELESLAYDPDGDPLELTWWTNGTGQFVNGTDAHSPKANYRFDDNGTYTVGLNVSDIHGTNASHEVSVTVELSGILPPAADFEVQTQGALTLEPVTFLERSSDPDGAGIKEWHWDFGDGNETTLAIGSNIQHSYAKQGTYTVTLTVTDIQDLTGLTTRTVTILNRVPEPVLDWTLPSPFDASGGLFTVDTIEFNASYNDPDGTIQAWHWDFDGLGRIIDSEGQDSGLLETYTSESGTVSFRFLDEGTYNVTVSLTDDDGGSGTSWSELMVLNTPPRAALEWSCDPACPDGITTEHVLTFQDASFDRGHGTVEDRLWKLGDGTTSDAVIVEHRFTDNGTYPVSLNVTDDDGATNVTVQLLVIGNQPPVADFSVFPASPTVVDDVVFRDLAFDLDGTIEERSWDFGDGNTSTELEPVHRFNDPGEYMINYTVRDDDGNLTTISKTLLVESAPPIPSFEWSADAETLTTQTAIQFQDTSIDLDGSVVSRTWDFGDGTSSTQASPTHSFADQGAYRVELTVTDDAGLTGTHARFFQIGNIPPKAEFTIDPGQPIAGETVRFTPVVTDPDGSSFAYHWVFGDGGNADTQEPNHSYAMKGRYEVQLVVTDDQGGSTVHSRAIDVGNAPPEASFRPDRVLVNTSEPVHFLDHSTDLDGQIIGWSWNFGDGQETIDRSPVHAFARAGIYDVELKVTDDDGQTDTSNRTIQVSNRAPGLGFTANPQHPVVGALVRFQASAEDPDGTITDWKWDFGDGESSTDPNPTHRFERQGDHMVRLEVTDDHNETSTFSRKLTVLPLPIKVEISHELLSAENGTVRFQGDAGSGQAYITRWQWDLGDGNTSTSPEPVHQYAEPGAYIVMLHLESAEGAETVQYTTVEIKESTQKLEGQRGPGAQNPIPGFDGWMAGVLLAGLALSLRRRFRV